MWPCKKGKTACIMINFIKQNFKSKAHVITSILEKEVRLIRTYTNLKVLLIKCAKHI